MPGDDAQVAPQYRGFIKKSLHDLPTPAMLVDLDLLDKNIRTLAAYLKGRPVGFRAHTKSHKCLEVAKLQLAAGGRGLCAAKLGEADSLIRGGIKDVLITAPVVGPLKIKRLMDLASPGARREGGRRQSSRTQSISRRPRSPPGAS